MFNKQKLIALTVTVFGLAAVLFAAAPAQAQLKNADYSKQLNAGGQSSGLNSLGAASGDPRVLTGLILKGVVSILGTVFVVIIVWAGSKYINSDGDSAEVDDAKAKIRMAIVGLLVTLASYSIASFLVNKSIESVNNAKPLTGYDQP